MKRYIMLFTFTFLAIAVTIIFGTISRNEIVQVNVVKVNPITVDSAITCSGRVERVSMHSVYASSSAIVNHVYIKVGDKVSAGQPLMEIEVPSANTGAENIGGSYESLLNQYGEQSQNKAMPQIITAPSSGVITSVSVVNQSYIQAGNTIAMISDDLNALQVRLSVNESKISGIKVGQKAVITGVGFKDTFYSGVVKSISSDAKQVVSTTGQETVVEVIASVNNPGSDIKPGYTAKARIITSKDSNVLIAPYETVRADKDGNEYVFKLSGKRAVKTAVVTNKEFDSGFQITSGLSQNDQIIANPDAVSNGTYVIPTEKGTVSSDD